jgi:tropomyosin
LNNRNKQLEEELELAQDSLKDLKTEDNEDVKKDLENALRKITMLEQELEDSDKSLKDTTSK